MEIVCTVIAISYGFYIGDKFIKKIFKNEENNNDNNKNNIKHISNNLVKVSDYNKNSSLVYNDNDLDYLPDELKQHLECGISGSLFKDPVITPQGYTFEKNTIVSWLSNSEICPYTKSVLKNNDLVDNVNIRNSIRFFLQFKYFNEMEELNNI